MYAVIQTGGKQYRVEKGDLLKIEQIASEPGQLVDFEEILMISDGSQCKVGKPVLSGAKVTAEVVKHDRHDKVFILKFRRRKHHMKRQGHRQNYTEVKITDITG